MITKDIGIKLKKELGLRYLPVGVFFSDNVPEGSKRFAKKGKGCIIPLIFLSAKGDTVSIDKDSTGWPCSAFYLGYKKWIFEGIECFLSDGTVFGRDGERFIKTRKQAKDFVTSFVPSEINNKVTIFKPLEKFNDGETPELVIFFVKPDELSGLIYLLHYNSPMADDIVITGFDSGCGSIFARPMKLIKEGQKKAVLGMNDISARTKMPKEILSLTMPYSLATEITGEINSSFVRTENWQKIKRRNATI